MDSLMGYWFKSASDELKDVTDVPKNINKGAKKVVTAVTEKKQKPLPEVLQEYDLPPAIFPREVKKYEIDEETKKITVTLPAICEVSYRDSTIFRFCTSVTGHLEKGKLTEIEGLKTKMVLWVKVHSIVSEDSKFHVAATLTKTKERKVFQVVRDGIPVDKF